MAEEAAVPIGSGEGIGVVVAGAACWVAGELDPAVGAGVSAWPLQAVKVSASGSTVAKSRNVVIAARVRTAIPP
jgi:hypothetical protein